MFSKTCEHAIKAVIFLARHSLDGQRANLKEIASGIESPVAFTAKILQLLVKKGIILSHQGAYGGFEMDVNTLKDLKLMQVVLAVDGDRIITDCVLGMHECSGENPCPFHEKYAPVRFSLVAAMETTTIYDLAVKLKLGKSTLR